MNNVNFEIRKIIIKVIETSLRLTYKLKLFKTRLILMINRKNVNLSSTVKINQKTIFTGKGKIEVGSDVIFGYKLGGSYRKGLIEIQARYQNSKIQIFENVAFNNSIFISAANSIEIGANTRIGANVTIFDFEAHGTKPNERNIPGRTGNVVIKDNVWIGNNVIILKDVCIGCNSIVSAGSVVYKGNYPDNVIISGNPAVIIKKIDI